MSNTKKMILVVVRDENEKFVNSWNIEPDIDLEKFESIALETVHEMDEIAGKPERELHVESFETRVYC